jgi:outer membrane protein
VNTDRIFREANPAKAAQAKLEQEFSKRERNWWIRATSEDRLGQVRARSAHHVREPAFGRQRQLVDQDREFQRKRREFQEDLNARKNEELAQVLDRANKVVKQVAELRSTTSSCKKPCISTPSSTSPTRSSRP